MSVYVGPAARDTLILRYVPMVRKIAYRIVARLPSSVDVEDLINIGMLGLIDAVDRYDHVRGTSFAGYARMRVQGAILDELRKWDWVPRSVRDRAERLRHAREGLSAKLGRAPTEGELAESLEVSVARLRELQEESVILSTVSMEEEVEEDITIGEAVPSDDASVEEEAQSHQVQGEVRRVLDELSARDRLIVEMYYFRDMTFKEIGDSLGVTESRISQLHTRIKERLTRKLGGVAREG